jgi:hypothetical protein
LPSALGLTKTTLEYGNRKSGEGGESSSEPPPAKKKKK